MLCTDNRGAIVNMFEQAVALAKVSLIILTFFLRRPSFRSVATDELLNINSVGIWIGAGLSTE